MVERLAVNEDVVGSIPTSGAYMKKDTSWGKEFVFGEYQKELILPNLLRLMEIKKGELVIDLACGPGFFANEFYKKGAKVIGVDISEELIKIAKENFPKIDFRVGAADKLPFLEKFSFDKIVFILAVQNIDNPQKVFDECSRILKLDGQLFIVMNHPAFRIPKQSDWGWDEEKKIQYRRVDKYLSELKEKIQTHPGDRPEDYTISFHRPLQFYFKALNKSGFAVRRLEEWNSHKQSEWGPRAEAEDIARKEIPLFLMMEATKSHKVKSL